MEERGWRAEVAEIERRRRLRERMGGPEGVERQHRHGKLTARERIAGFVDDGSFREFYSLAGEGTYEGSELKSFVPRPVVEGTARIDGRKIVLTAGDFTIRGGSGGAGAAWARSLRRTNARASGRSRSFACSMPPGAACGTSRRSAAPTSRTAAPGG